MACEAVNGPPPTAAYEAAHLCGNGHLACVNPRHVVWKTRADNHADKLIHGTHSRGEKHGGAKLSNADASMIRRLKGVASLDELADGFNVSKTTIWKIQVGASFKS
jgi:hypothetical protein